MQSKNRGNLITKTTEWAMEIVSRYVTEGDTVIDATMGNGRDTLALARLVGSTGRVIAFDIQPQALENTKALLVSNGISTALWTEPPTAHVALWTEWPAARVQLILDSNANLRKYIDGEKVSSENKNREKENHVKSCLTHEIESEKNNVEEGAEQKSKTNQKEIAAILFNLGYLPGGDKTVTTTKEETLKAMAEAAEVVKSGGLVAAVLYSGHEQGAEEKDALLQWAQELSPKEYHVAYIAMWNQKKHPPELLLITKK